jgi:surface protein
MSIPDKNTLTTEIDNWISSASAQDNYQTSTYNSTYGAINTWTFANTLTDMSQLFKDKTNFNADISDWNVGNVTTMAAMFQGATNFNQPLNNWNTASVTDMQLMFESATSFNQPLDGWNNTVSNVTSMDRMFANATSFNQDISNWTFGNTISRENMFQNATAFDQNLRDWTATYLTMAYYPICFPANTPICTDQGKIPICKINPKIHTILQQPIRMVTKTKTYDKYLVCFKKDSLKPNTPNQDTYISKNHAVYNNGKWVHAFKYVNDDNIVKTKYNGETLYNILMDTHSMIMVNNIVCETLHPNNAVVQLNKFIEDLPIEKQEQVIKQFNDAVQDQLVNNKKPVGKVQLRI